MKKERIIKLIIIFTSGNSQIISIHIKNEKDLELFKSIKFKNIIKMREIK